MKIKYWAQALNRFDLSTFIDGFHIGRLSK